MNSTFSTPRSVTRTVFRKNPAALCQATMVYVPGGGRKAQMAGCVSFRTPPVWRHNNRRGHIRVQTAVDKDDTGIRKRHCARLVFWIIPQVK